MQCSRLCSLLFFSFENKVYIYELKFRLVLAFSMEICWIFSRYLCCEKLKMWNFTGPNILKRFKIDFTIRSFFLSSFISSFSLRALKTCCLSEEILFLRGESGPSTRDSFTYGESVHEIGAAPSWGPKSSFGIFWGVRQGSCCDGVEDGDSGQPDVDGRHGEDGGQLAAVVASENVEFCESSLLISTGMGEWGKDLAAWKGDDFLDGSDGRETVFPVDGGAERTLGLARFGVAEILLLLWSTVVAGVLTLDGAPSLLSMDNRKKN